ncbi:hypothetical protein JTB14_010930 [Gonioctena quinquepunctata]|nr:hypothetical protein JTB14_010930 [Gonioctena quinquepunctata]
MARRLSLKNPPSSALPTKYCRDSLVCLWFSAILVDYIELFCGLPVLKSRSVDHPHHPHHPQKQTTNPGKTLFYYSGVKTV